MIKPRAFIVFVLLFVVSKSCTPDDDKYKRIVNKSWIQDSSHSFLTAYSFEFEAYVGQTLGEFLSDYPDTIHLHQFMEDPVCTLKGWFFRYGEDDLEVMTFFNYDTYEEVVTRDTMSLMEWNLEEYLDQEIRKFEVRDYVNNNTIVPRKYDKLNRAP